MKTIFSIFLAVGILFFISSCSNIIFVQKTYDPEIITEKFPCSIVFVNSFDFTSPSFVREKNENSYHSAVMKLVEGLNEFSRDESFRFMIGDTLKRDILPGQLTAFLPVDTIAAICKRHKADKLLTLDSLDIFFNWETIVNDNGGEKEKVKNFYLHTRFYLSFYSLTGDLIKRSMVEESSLYKSRAALSALITFKPSIANAVETVKSLSFQAGQDYVSKFYPETVNESRKLYAGKAFKESNLFIKLRNWDKATELLEQLAKSADQDLAMKARHNLSVVKEAASLVK